MLDGMETSLLAAVFGMLGGLVLGLAARLGRFCTLGAIEDALYGGSDLRLRSWGVAIGTAMTASFALMAAGVFEPHQTFYLGAMFNPLAAIAGGLMFGYGMALAGNCGYGALARLGGGDMRAFVIVLVLGLASYVALSGPLAEARIWLFRPGAAPAPQGIAHWLGAWTGLSPSGIGMAAGLALVAVSLAPARARRRPGPALWGGLVGLAIAGGWACTAWLAHDRFGSVPVESHTFSAPVGETLLYLMTSTGSSLSFGVGSIAGVLGGALIGSIFKGHFRWEACEDPRELRRQIGGAALMGVGAVVAGGCSVGQGLSAMSLLAFSAPLTLAAMFAGAALGLRQLIEGLVPVE